MEAFELLLLLLTEISGERHGMDLKFEHFYIFIKIWSKDAYLKGEIDIIKV